MQHCTVEMRSLPGAPDSLYDMDNPMLSPFPNDKLYTLSKLKEFCRWRFQIRQKLGETERVLQMAISNSTKMGETSPKGQKTLWEKEKLLVTINFSFSQGVFKRLV